MAGYSFDNTWEKARQRLRTIEERYDPGTIWNLEQCGVAEGWQCLEIGAGGGSIAGWLCERVGAQGTVVATDLEPRFLEALDYPNLEVRRHNVVTDDLPVATFDLVHARMVLEHLPQRATVLRRLAAALRPGGWLVCEDLDELSITLVAPLDDTSVAVFGTIQHARRSAMEARGFTPFYGRQLGTLFRGEGLVDVRAEGRVMLLEAGQGAQFSRLTIEQLRDDIVAAGLASAADVEAWYALLDDPAFVMVAPTLFTARGRRPVV